jgi:hypothetical protein
MFSRKFDGIDCACAIASPLIGPSTADAASSTAARIA